MLSGGNRAARPRSSRRRRVPLYWLGPASTRRVGSLCAAPPPSTFRLVVRWAPQPPSPLGAQRRAHGDFRPPPSRVAGTFQLPSRRLLRQSRLRHQARFTCSGLGSLRRSFSPSADFCPPIGLPLDSPSTRQV